MTTELALTDIKINAVPAQIDFDAPTLNAMADQYLEKYTSYVVTEENLADDKKLAQELGRNVTLLNRFRIDTKKQLTEPITAFEKDIKGVADKFANVRSMIDEQVAKFEAQRIKEIREIIESYFAKQERELGIRKEYANFAQTIESLTMLTAVTAKGNLTAKTQREADAALQQALGKQNTTDLRLAQLEAECYRLGLAAPLTHAHVQHIVHLDDDEYRHGLEKIVAAEIEREQQAVEAHRAKLEKEVRAEAEAKVRAEEAAKRKAEEEELAKHKTEQAELERQRQVRRQEMGQPAPELEGEYQQHFQAEAQTIVTCVFKLDVSANVPTEAIENKFREQLASAGFTTLSHIQIQRH